LEPEGKCGCHEHFVNHETGNTKDVMAKRVPGDQIHEDETVQNENLDGHTADRTNMLPWDSCGPDCPVCAESEK